MTEVAERRGSVTARCLFFAALLVGFALAGQVGLPSVHAFFDGVAMRDTCTVWHSLTWDIRDQRHFLPAAVLSPNEGPLQFLVLNLYCHTVGDLLPLNPRTMQIPNTVLALLSAAVAFLLGHAIHSERFGYLCALSLATVPWLVITIRAPWVFNFLSVLCEFTAFWLYIRFAAEPGRPWLRLAAPASLALYLLTGVDWPSFLFALGLFLILAGRVRTALRNAWNILPLAVVAVFVGWAIALFLYGRYYAPQHGHLYQRALLVFPFFKVLGAGSLPGWGRVFEYAWQTFGPGLAIGLGGVAVAAVTRGRPAQTAATSEPALDALRPKVLAAMGIWLLAALVPLLRTSNASSYGYVVAVPMAIMSACLLASVRAHVAAMLLAATFVCQVLPLPIYMTVPDSADKRVLAAAAFLNEERPDLLRAEKTALLPTDEASNVGQYARGQNARLVMPFDYPALLDVHGISSRVDLLKDFVEAYNGRGEIKADWVVLTSAHLAEDNPGREFFRRLRADPRIHWIATFKGGDGRAKELWVGEVTGTGGGGPAQEYDVEALAKVYERKYDRISFLKKNAKYVMHE